MSVAGPILVVPKSFDQKTHLAMVSKLVELGSLRPSDELIWSYIYTAKELSVEHETDQEIHIRVFQGFELATGRENPDFTNKKPLKLGIQARYARIKSYIENGAIINWTGDVDKEYGSGRLKFYTPSFPTLSDTEKSLIDRAPSASTDKRINQTLPDDEQIQTAILPLTQMGSFQMFANIIGRCVRIDRSDKRKTFISEFTIPGNQDRPSGKIRVVTSALDKSEIMLPEDLLLVDVVYSKIKELLRSKHGITYPLRNLFTLDKVDIAHDLHKTDSGAGRELLHQQFERINATEYDVESCENARWLMRQFQFINEIGEVYDKKRIRWLSIEGERYDPNGSERSKRASRYISVSLPEFLFDAINNWLKTREGDILPMFTRDKKLVKQSAAGQIWALNNYLDMIAPRPGNYRKPIGLDKFITSFVPHMEEKRQIEYLSIVKILIDKDRLIYAFNLSINIRKQPRLKYAASLVGRHLIVLRNITPSASQLSRIKYDIEHVKLNDTQHNVAKEQLAKVKAEPNYQDDEHAYKWIQSILDSSSFFAKEQNV